jgi:hypothetical protein
MGPVFPLSLRERVRVRVFKALRRPSKPLTPRPLPRGEGARATEAENLKCMLMLY